MIHSQLVNSVPYRCLNCHGRRPIAFAFPLFGQDIYIKYGGGNSLALAICVRTCNDRLVCNRACEVQHFAPRAVSPYFNATLIVAPPQFCISDETPPGCAVDQAAYILRHGARYPEPGGSVGGWESLFAKFQSSDYTASGSLAFMPSWTPAIDAMGNEPFFLTAAGAMETFDLGVNSDNVMD